MDVDSSSAVSNQPRPWWMRFRSAIDLWFPPVCACCQCDVPPDVQLCGDCLLKLRPDDALQCRKCAAPVPQGFSAEECPHCRGRKFKFDRAWAIHVYDGELRTAVLRMKRPASRPLAWSAAELLAQRILANPPPRPFDAVAPVPMHWTRYLKRGANSAETLAEVVARRVGAPLVVDLLRFRRRIEQQSLLSPARRRENIRGSLQVVGGAVSGRHILIVDDIMTTGATANEAAKTLKRAGAEEISIAVAARSVT